MHTNGTIGELLEAFGHGDCSERQEDLRREIFRLRASNETYKTVALGALHVLGKVPDAILHPDLRERQKLFSAIALETEALCKQLRPPSTKA